ncbi:MAG: right-handed parallel beta-helix repeat-containing protein [Nanoarchaeota archaeon]|nr:right-handed parallel beta-helix repeat-containing protein [Nanoarchaeota archaeon]
MIVLLSAAVLAYTPDVSVRITDKYFYEIEPKLITGKEISNANGDCLYIKGSEWVIIRGNYLHDCKTTGKKDDGYAMYIENVNNLVIENNVINNSFRGIYLKNVKHVTIRNNNQTNTYRDASFKLQDCDDIKIYDNYAKDNGATEVMIPVSEGTVGLADGRLQGIVLWTSSNAEIYGNTVINSSSDGIGLAGVTRENPELRSHNFKVYNNTVISNGEQGIWLEGAQDAEIYNNYVAKNKARPGFGGGSSGIHLEYDAKNNNIHDNLIESNDVCGISIRNSPDNMIERNTIKGNNVGGICLDGETVMLPEYHFVGNMRNKIYRNFFINNQQGNINMWAGANDQTEVYFNTFDTTEKESIKYQGNEDIRHELILKDNSFKLETKKEQVEQGAEEKVQPSEQQPPQEESGQEQPEEGDEEVIIIPSTEGDPIVAYALLTLFFVILVVAIILFSVRRSNKKR